MATIDYMIATVLAQAPLSNGMATQSNWPQSLSLWSIRLSMLAMFLCYAQRWLIRPSERRFPKHLWLAGAVLAAIHTFSALPIFHDGSLAAAEHFAANKTDALLGIRFGRGIYFNYAFVAVWLTDAIVRIARGGRDFQRNRALWWLIDAFLITIAINGTIVFASGPIRYVGITCLIGLAVAKIAQRYRNSIR